MQSNTKISNHNNVVEARDILITTVKISVVYSAIEKVSHVLIFNSDHQESGIYFNANISISNLAKTWTLIPPCRIIDTGIQPQIDTHSFRSFE